MSRIETKKHFIAGRSFENGLDNLAMAGDGLDFCGELGYAEHGLSIPVPICFIEVSKQRKFFGLEPGRWAFEGPLGLRFKGISNLKSKTY
jgi:hypothetical protein